LDDHAAHPPEESAAAADGHHAGAAAEQRAAFAAAEAGRQQRAAFAAAEAGRQQRAAFAAAEAWRQAEAAQLYANMSAEDWETAARWKQYAEPYAPERTCAQPLPQQLLSDIAGLSAALARQPTLTLGSARHWNARPALTNSSRATYLALLAFHSTGLEGNALTLQETLLAVQGQPQRAELRASVEEASSTARLWQGLGLDSIPREGPHPLPLARLDLAGLVAVNAAITRGTDTPTGLRRRHVAIGRQRTMLPMPDEVPALVREFLAWLARSALTAAAAPAPQPPQPAFPDAAPELPPAEAARLEAALALACNAHTRFVYIHPFADGNGRTARTLSALALQHSGLPAPMIPRQRRSEYMAAVSSATMARDYAPLALMHAQAVHRSLSCLAELLWGQAWGERPRQPELAMAARGGGCGTGSQPEA
jgi:hypothetical protein